MKCRENDKTKEGRRKKEGLSRRRGEGKRKEAYLKNGTEQEITEQLPGGENEEKP